METSNTEVLGWERQRSGDELASFVLRRLGNPELQQEVIEL